MNYEKPNLVMVAFPPDNRAYPYLNYLDLEIGDFVFVEGKFENVRGMVVDISENFKVKKDEYKKVVSVADTKVNAEFEATDTHFVTKDTDKINFQKVITWFKPNNSNEEYIDRHTDSEYHAMWENCEFDVSPSIIRKGIEYYENERVLFLEIGETLAYAIVAGDDYYITEFEIDESMIGEGVCSCRCFGTCKHIIATKLLLKELVDKGFSPPFCAISKPVLMKFTNPKKIKIE